jgi:hypothetical protein
MAAYTLSDFLPHNDRETRPSEAAYVADRMQPLPQPLDIWERTNGRG